MELPEYIAQPHEEAANDIMTAMTPDDFMTGVSHNILLLGKLMKQRFSYAAPSLMPYYHELSSMQSDSRRSFGETNNRGSKFSFVHSVPYGRQPTSDRRVFMYQRLGAYYQGSAILALVHLVDPGDAVGPGANTDAFLNVGAMRSPKKDALIWFNGKEGAQEVTDEEEIASLYESFVVGEVEELQSTHLRETAVPMTQRNLARPVTKTVGAVSTFMRIARGKNQG
jgi:hypothetical protein